MSFNDADFLREFREFVLGKVFGLKVLEVGCYSGEMLETLSVGEGLSLETDGSPLAGKWCRWVGEDAREFAKRVERQGTYDLVFSSGLLEQYEEDEAVEILKAMAKLVKVSSGRVLNYVPNARCEAYLKAKEAARQMGAPWANERAFTCEELEALHQKAGLVVVDSGTAAGKWVGRFGGGAGEGEPYLVWCLAVRADERAGSKAQVVRVVKDAK